MPNNKGGVPMYNENPQYNATINPQLPQGSPAMYGTQVAKEMAGYGDAMSKLGEKIVDYAVKRQQQEDDNYIMRRENDMREQLNNLLYNPQDGLANTKLHNAKGSTMAFDEAADKLTQQFMMDVKNPYLQAKFQAHISQWLPSYRKNIAVHEGDETFKARNADNETSMKDKIDFRLITPNGESASALLNDLRENREYLINTLGLSPKAADEVIQDKYSNGILLMAQKASANGDTQAMLDIQNASKGKLTAEAEAKLAGLTGKTISKMKGVQAAQKYLNNPKYRNPDGTLNELALKAFEKDYGIGSTRTEKVMVGGTREGHANAWVVYDVFKEAGYNDEAIAGILGRVQQEHNFNTEMAEEKDVPGIGRVGGFGMFQWQMDPEYGGRGISFHNWAKENGLDVNDAKVQAQYALKEAKEKGLTPEVMNQLSAEDAATKWTDVWEIGKHGSERKYAGEWRGRISTASQTGHYEERTVSNYNEQEYNEGYNYLKSQIEYSKAEHDVVFNNALNDALGKATSLRMPSEVMALAKSYGLNETDSTRLYKILLGNRLDLADEQQRFSDNQRSRTLQKQAEEDAADNFYTWWNANPNASNTDVQQKAADCGVSPRFMHSINNMIAKSSQGVSWFKSQYNKKVFNNAVSQNNLKGEQISNAMDIVTQKEAEKGSALTPDEITTIVNKASAETVIYEGKWYEKDVKGRAVDFPGGNIGKDRNGVSVTNEDGVNVVNDVDEDDFE